MRIRQDVVRQIRLLIAVIVVAFMVVHPVSAEERVELQLKWKHAFQFAGYYMALEKGYYEEEGLNVRIIEGSPEHSPLSHILKGPANYAVTDSGALVARSRDLPVKAVAVIFQHSPLALAVLKESGIHSFSDLAGKRVMMQRDHMDASILAAIYKSGLKEADFERVDTSFNIQDLIDKKVDAFSVYTTDQPHQLKEKGVKYQILHPHQSEIDFYGDILITSDLEAEAYPERVEAMRRASLKGWIYALDHIDEAIALIKMKYNSQNLSDTQLYFEANRTAKMIIKDEIEIGYMSELRWKRIENTYVNLGMINESGFYPEFMFEHHRSLKDELVDHKWQALTLLLLIMLVFFVIQAVVLTRIVNKRTAALKVERQNLQESKSLQQAISNVLELIVSGNPLQEIFEEIISVFEQRHNHMKCSILLVRDGKLHKGAAQHLPDAYNDAIDGVAIGPMVGSCGTAAYLKQRVIVTDIVTDPRWDAYKGVALKHGLRACWSEPILSSEGEILGTFAMYYDHVREPSVKEMAEIASAAKITGVAIEHRNTLEKIRKLSRATEQAGESVLITDKNGVIEYVNPSFTSITGYQPEEVIGNTPELLRSGKQNKAYYKHLWDTILEGKVWQGSIVDKRKDGSEYSSMMTISPIFDERNEISHFVASQLDMSAYEALEENFRQAQKMEAVGTLVGGIAHDFNNTLAAISNHLFMAKMEVEDRPHVMQILDQVDDLSFSAAETIKQLLAFARKDMIEMRPFSLTNFMNSISKLHKSTVPENIRFTESYTQAPLIIKGDESQMQQVVLNLLNNARDAVADVENPEVTLTLEHFVADDAFMLENPEMTDENFALIKVKDNGKGIKDEDKSHVFEPFFTTKEVGEGTGLGLSMTYGSVQRHGGVIQLESSEKGTTFSLYIPLYRSGLSDLNEQLLSPVEIREGKGETILVVDDDLELLESSRSVFERVGYRVLVAHDGKEALEMYTQHQSEIQMVMTDVVMPVMGGVQSVEKMRDINPDLNVIFCTGYDKDTTLIDVKPSTHTVILTKPYKIDEVREIISNFLADMDG